MIGSVPCSECTIVGRAVFADVFRVDTNDLLTFVVSKVLIPTKADTDSEVMRTLGDRV